MAQCVTGRLECPFDVLAHSPSQGCEQEGGAGGRGLGGHDSRSPARVVATRYDNLAALYEATVLVAAINERL